MNPMYASLNTSAVQSPASQQIMQLRTMMEAIRNPWQVAQGAVMAQLQNHPFYTQAKTLADRYGGDWNRAFEETAKQNGIDPNQIKQMLRQQGLIR